MARRRKAPRTARILTVVPILTEEDEEEEVAG